ncbi:MAG: hypothetical protein KKB13_30270 [Chloroflexi bacterium]|nr:hypothetical protein [Chloroflexota bacterium]
MMAEALEKAIVLAQQVGHALIATVDAIGLPHLASVGKLIPAPDGYLVMADWFCPDTLTNLLAHSLITMQPNRRVAILIWDAVEDDGYQCFGEEEEVLEVAGPPVERRLLVRVDDIVPFSHVFHDDITR